MSVQVAIFERMFDHGEMPALALSAPVDPRVDSRSARIEAVDTVQALQAQQGNPALSLPTPESSAPAIAPAPTGESSNP